MRSRCVIYEMTSLTAVSNLQETKKIKMPIVKVIVKVTKSTLTQLLNRALLFRLTKVIFKLTGVLFRLTKVIFRLTGVLTGLNGVHLVKFLYLAVSLFMIDAMFVFIII